MIADALLSYAARVSAVLALFFFVGHHEGPEYIQHSVDNHISYFSDLDAIGIELCCWVPGIGMHIVFTAEEAKSFSASFFRPKVIAFKL